MCRRITIFISLFIHSFLLYCSSTQFLHIEYKQPVSLHENNLLAGASKVDITPPPGMPLAGYSSNAHYAQGFRTRLYARVIYLKSQDNAIALVQCDLLSGSSLVQKKVGELISRTTDVPYSGIMIAGTHTHSGPGNYFESNFYNRFASNASGFDKEYFNFLCNNIAAAITQAYKNRKPAAIAYGSKTLYGFTRNRSLHAFNANKNAFTDNPLKAVNPFMHMLRVDSIEGGTRNPMAAFTVFSIHGTTVPDTNTLYSGDVFAYIERELEWEMQRKGVFGFVHAVCNGTHADNAPNILKGKQGFEESKRLGILLGQHAIELFNQLHSNTKADIAHILKEIDVYQHPSIDSVTVCTPKVGNTLLAGASDGGPTPVISSLPFFKEGSKSCLPFGCHKQKQITGGPLQSLILPKDDFPHNLTFQVIKLNEVLLLPVPFEVTYESGNRMAALVRQTSNTPIIPIVISCANGYTGYCTTPEEYSMQHYEGGHTLYGPNTLPYLVLHYAHLTATIANNNTISDSNWEKHYTLKSTSFLKRYPTPLNPIRKAVQQPHYVVNPGIDEPYICFMWEDVPPDQVEFNKPLVAIEYYDNNTFKPFLQNDIPVDDSGYDIAVIFTGKLTSECMAIYEARWYNPPLDSKYTFRFVILPRENVSIHYSEQFSW